MWAPKGTPHEVIAKLNAAVVEALGDEIVRRRLTDLGQEIPSRSRLTPGALANLQRTEIEKWWPIVRAMDLNVK
jgi:tripartite-type tricarboxylate transporter receptor subunit TctC